MLVDKHENTEALIKTITELYLKGVDSRQLALLKIGFVRTDKDNRGSLKLSQFKKVFTTIMRQTHSEDEEVFDIICKYVTNSTPN